MAVTMSYVMELVKLFFLTCAWATCYCILLLEHFFRTKIKDPKKFRSPKTDSNDKIAICMCSLNIGPRVESVLDSIFKVNDPKVEVFIADGGSTDETLDIMKRYDVTIVKCPKGRANGLNASAKMAILYSDADIIINLHGDTQLPENWNEIVRKGLANKKKRVVGYFSFTMEPLPGIEGWCTKLIELTCLIRTTVCEHCTGDMTFHMYRDDFIHLGGYGSIPLMEDVEFCTRVQKEYDMTMSGYGSPTDCRRWKGKGILLLANSIWNYIFYTSYALGLMSEEDIHKRYYPGRKLPTCYALDSPLLLESLIKCSEQHKHICKKFPSRES